jgi:hypothetical protein
MSLKARAVALLMLLGGLGGCGCAFAEAKTSKSEVWEARYLFARVVANVRQEGNTLKGVAWVHGVEREVLTYHFSGTVHEGKILASHYTGHEFRGEMVSDRKAVGVLTTSKGWSFRVEAKRRGPMVEDDLEAHP